MQLHGIKEKTVLLINSPTLEDYSFPDFLVSFY